MLLVAQTWTSASNSSTGGSLCKGVYGRFMEGGLLLLPLWSTTAMDGTRQLWHVHSTRNTEIQLYMSTPVQDTSKAADAT